MNPSLEKVFLCLCISLATIKSVYSINCYQCSGTDSNNPFQCNEFLENDVDLVPTDCATIFDAQYCIKHVGRFEGLAINCYQCNTSSTMECGDGLMKLDGGILTATSCEHVYEAQYCIKLQGGIGTKRYCSSRDLGNYCNYVQQPGDKLEYRTCIYTCDTDGCNSATSLKIPAVFTLLVIAVKYFVL
ncbi:glycosylphosphatidylinositol anchored membrane protein boudin isoform X2 [Anticarsia gemmatalis]|uniref:glycosylphosphatidylinositol anchored membrane protein boudin isoform X2 n=1 Tax=Anticarsia gemmatalis TaxID=129554 RepID=UPI003F771E9D